MPVGRRTHLLRSEQLVRRPPDEVFAFFAEAANLQAITPDFLHFRIETPLPIAMRDGTLIDYRLSLWGLPVRWRSRIEDWRPGAGFVDRQLTGPYSYWRHTHEFRAVAGGTLVIDTVEYALPFGPLGALVRALFVRRTLEKIFEHRRRRIEEELP